MADFLVRNIVSDDFETELSLIGFDSSYKTFAARKFEYKNLKIYNLSSAQANILKQTALSVGSDCATHRDVITGKIEKSNVILTGSISQLTKIADKLKHQPFGLKILGEQILSQTDIKKSESTKLFGILNITPDSFSDGGKYYEPKDAINHLVQMFEDGADFIDIGAESTRPNSKEVTAEEQIKRLEPILDFTEKENLGSKISVDTRSSIVADYALNKGVSIINDVSGFDYDEKMPNVISKYNAGVIIQHSKGIPQNMQDNPEYKNVVEEIYFSLKSKSELAESYGIKNIIIDPGIGFGKTKEHNFEILDRIEEFYSLNLPLMVGVSRKRLLGIEEDDNELKDSLTLALSYPLIQKHVDFLRVHNVKLHKRLLKLL